jgi:phage gp46-like protein
MSFNLTALSSPINSADGLNHAVLQSLLNFATAKSNDTIDDGHHRQGWWASDKVKAIGSREWTLSRAKNTSETRIKLKRLSEHALQWLIKEGYATAVSVEIIDHQSWVERLITISLSNKTIFNAGQSITIAVPYNFTN